YIDRFFTRCAFLVLPRKPHCKFPSCFHRNRRHELHRLPWFHCLKREFLVEIGFDNHIVTFWKIDFNVVRCGWPTIVNSESIPAASEPDHARTQICTLCKPGLSLLLLQNELVQLLLLLKKLTL